MLRKQNRFQKNEKRPLSNQNSPMLNAHFKNYLEKQTHASDSAEVEVIQSLWSGYGQISRVALKDSGFASVVVKQIEGGQPNRHPRGWNTHRSHARKVKSYQVETHWYKNFASLCTKNCKVPGFIGSWAEGNTQCIILEDLKGHYPNVLEQVSNESILVCLKWLAHFHAAFLFVEPIGLWRVGTYWHLDTRPDELQQMANLELQSKAKKIDTALSEGVYQTLVHGDAKLANFCFSKDAKEVAAVDFQYVGGGCGIKDVMYFLGSCMSSDQMQQQEKELLDYYFDILKKALKSRRPEIDCDALEKEWRDLYPIASTDFLRFLLGWMPSHQKINDYSLTMMNQVLKKM